MKSINIITGASKGLGKSLAINLSNYNTNCILIARNKLELQEVASECIKLGSETKVLCADFSSINEIEDLVEQLKINLPRDTAKITLYNNASTIQPISKINSIKPKDFDNLFRINLTAAFALAAAVSSIVIENNIEGFIVNISSGVSKKAIEGWSAYCASKAGLNMLTNSLVAEAKAFGNSINAVSINPGALDTDMQLDIRLATSHDLPITEKFITMHNDGLLNDVDDVAKKIIELVNSKNFPSDEFIDFNLL